MSRLVPARADVVLGTAEPPYPHPQFRLTPTAQRHHALLWGSTGAGKSKLLQSIFLQHVNKGAGIGLIDPHSDLALSCLSYLTGKGFFRRPGAFEDLVYLDFGQGSFVPFNVLNQPYNPHSVSLNALEAMTRVWPDLKRAPLFRTLFLSSALVLIENKLPLTCIYQLLLDREFRQACLVAARDPLIHQTFDFYGRHGGGQAGSTLRRAFLLSFSPVARYCLGQLENWLDMRSILDSRKSLIVNLGGIDDLITRRLLGALIMVQIEQAALSRTDLPDGRRPHWTLLVDEWPSFAAAQPETIENVLAQTRKYGLSLYLSGQSLAQVESRRLAGALENCHLSVTFRLGHDSARIQAQHIGQVDPFRVKQAARTLRQRDQYMSTSEQRHLWEQTLEHLPPRAAFAKQYDQPAVKIRSLTVRQPRVTDAQLVEVLTEYRRRYQRTQVQAERAVGEALAPLHPHLSADCASGEHASPNGMLEESTHHDDIDLIHPQLETLFRERAHSER